MTQPHVLRSREVAVSGETIHGLRIVAHGLQRSCPDDLAEEVLKGWLNKNYPEVLALIRSQTHAEHELESKIASASGIPLTKP